MKTDLDKQNNRWYILTLAILTYIFIAGIMRLSVVVLFKEISLDLNLSLVDIGAVWGMDPLAGVFISLLGGLLVDRFGIRNTLTVVCVLAGVFGALRGLSTDFTSMAATMFLFGLVGASIPTIVPKITAIWFKGRYLILTNAILFIAMSLGGMIGTMISATIMSPLMGGWKNVIFVYSIPAIIIGALWFTTIKKTERTDTSISNQTPVKLGEALSHVVRIKEVWLLGLIMMSQMGTMMGITGYLPIYLRDIGWPPASADAAVTIVIGLCCISTIPFILFVGKLRSHKFMLITTVIITSLSLALFSFFDGALLWILLGLYSLLRILPLSLVNTITIETEGVGGKYAGTAIGLVITFGMLGGFFFPPVGNSLESISPSMPFIFWAAMCLLVLTGIIFMRK